MKSFSLLRTNPGLTTNVKIIVDSNYNLYLESIDSVSQLSMDRFKKFQFIPTNYYDDLLPHFFNQFPIDLAYAIKYDNDNASWGSNFSNQYDDIYQMGARNIIDNKNYSEEYEFLAPLYVFKQSIPEAFIIFRTDGPGLANLNKDNFKSIILNNLKCVKVFDLTKSSSLGQWIDTNFRINPSFPTTGFELDYRKLEFSKWHGIDFTSGGYTYKSFFLDETLEIENTIHDLEKFVFDGYKQTKVVFPHILNFTYLFDDTPATPTSLRNWSLNQYYGFYIDDMELVQSITPFASKPLYDDVVIGDGNILYSLTQPTPFIGGYNPKIDYWVELNGTMFKIETFQQDVQNQFVNIPSGNQLVFNQEFTQTTNTQFRIISATNFSGQQSLLNQNICYIDSNNYLIRYKDGSYYNIQNFELSDVWLVEINGQYHRLIQDGTGIKVLSDYAFGFTADVKFEYWINDPDPNYRTTLNIFIEKNATPFSFKIYRLNFTDIKDFDTQLIDNKLSKFEYELQNNLTVNDETKMYTTDMRIKSNPHPFNDYQFGNKVVNIPVSSDYTANFETFRVENNDLSDIWRKNPVYSRWAYQNSISAHDYPYLMNNSTLHEDYNRIANVSQLKPNQGERNLDYFYTANSGTAGYLDHTLHIEDNSGSVQNYSFIFDIGKYLNISTYNLGGGNMTYSYDYFTLFFGKTQSFLNGQILENKEKWSLFEAGDSSIPNMTVFRGLKFKIFDVDNLKVDNGFIESVNLNANNNYQDYKFSILLTGTQSIDRDHTEAPKQYFSNPSWKIIDTWKHDKLYYQYDMVIYQDTIYWLNTSTNIISDPNKFLIDTSVWIEWHNSDIIFYQESQSFGTYSVGKVVYHQNEWWSKIGNTDLEFWTPGLTYTPGDSVISNSQEWECIVSSRNQEPSMSQYLTNSYISSNITLGATYGYWKSVDKTSWNWGIIPLWNPSNTYVLNDYVVHNESVWISIVTSVPTDDEPRLNSTSWQKYYSFVPDNQTTYNSRNFPILLMNDSYYLYAKGWITPGGPPPTTKPKSSKVKLDNGIAIYVNHKYKNVLVTIQVNDDTTGPLRNYTRDSLYNELNSRLTAANLMQSINDLHTKYGFVNYVTYIIIAEDGSYTSYNMDIGITGLSSMLVCEDPDLLQVQHGSLDMKPITVDQNVLKPKKTLDNGLISSDLSNINYYNFNPLAVSFERKADRINIIPNYHGQTNVIYNNLYRHSGYYMPLFYTIDLFQAPVLIPGTISYTEMLGNYRFDTDLTNFGMIKQRIISKVNPKGPQFKLKDNKSNKPIYPMLDEFGYSTQDFFIFKSTWDLEYHIQCDQNNT